MKINKITLLILLTLSMFVTLVAEEKKSPDINKVRLGMIELYKSDSEFEALIQKFTDTKAKELTELMKDKGYKKGKAAKDKAQKSMVELTKKLRSQESFAGIKKELATINREIDAKLAKVNEAYAKLVDEKREKRPKKKK